MDDDLINKIKRISTTNLDIIERIKEKASENVLSRFTYSIKKKDTEHGRHHFTVEEKLLKIKGSVIIKKYKKPLSLKVPIDLFNDRLDYKCESFDDMTRLNNSMVIVIEKYAFLDPYRAQPELTKFFFNFEAIQVGLLDAESTLVNEYTSENKLSYYQRELEDINERLNMIFMQNDVNTRKDQMWTTPCTSHTIVENKATLISGQYGALLSSEGFTSGIHRWDLRVITRTSTCMLGVANATVSKSGSVNNYSSNGFYMNLDDGSLYSGPPTSYSNRACLNRGVPSGSNLSLILNFEDRTLTYVFDGKDYKAYENLPLDKEFFLSWDNNTTAGSEIEILEVD